MGIARRLRPLIALTAVAGAAATAPTLAAAAPPHAMPHAKPSVASVQKQLGELALKNSQLVEKYDRAQLAVQRRERAAHAAQATVTKARAAYRRAHQEFAEIIQAQYESGNLGAAAALLDSSSGTNYLNRLDTLGMVSTHMAQVVEAVTAASDTASEAAAKASRLLAAARSDRNAVVRQRQNIAARISRYKKLLATLTAQQQWLYQRTANPSVSSATVASLHLPQSAPSPAARRAVQFALNQVGKPYVFGAAGPGAYDCSGLTMAAWRAGGVNLPHSAAEQYNYGRHVTRAELQPGDLIFFYQPIGHVTIYAGDGLMVSAPTEGENVSVVPLSAFLGDYTGATRLTG